MQEGQLQDGILFIEEGFHPLGYIKYAGFHSDGKGVAGPTFRVLDFFALVFVLEGQALYKDVSGLRLSLKPCDLLLIHPGTPHTYTPSPKKRWDEFWICFQGPIFDVWASTGILSPHRPVYRLAEKQYWLDRFVSLIPISQKDTSVHLVERACALQSLLAEVLIYHDNAALMPSDVRWLKQASNLLAKRLQPRLVANQLHCSYDSFRRRFLRLAHEPPGRYQMRQLILESARVIVREKLTNREAADRYGFSSEFHFSRVFRKVMGLSPLAYRQKAK